MPLVSSLFEDEYLPEFGTVVVRDHAGPDPLVPWVGWGDQYREELDESFSDALVCGSVMRAGAGWLQGSAFDDWNRVRLEAYDAPPELQLDWADIAESPYLAGTGFVGLTSMTGDDNAEHMALGAGAGSYRVRVSRREEEDGPSWLIQWWPAEGPFLAPRSIKLDRQTSSQTAADVRYLVADLVAIASWTPGVVYTAEDLTALLRVESDALHDALLNAAQSGVLAVGRSSPGGIRLTVLPSRHVLAQRERQAQFEERFAVVRSRFERPMRGRGEDSDRSTPPTTSAAPCCTPSWPPRRINHRVTGCR